jgi:hypothetical protein
MIDNIIDIEELGFNDPVDLDIRIYEPGNNTNLPKYRIHKQKLYLYVSKSVISKFVSLNEVIDYCPKEIFNTVIYPKYKRKSTSAMSAGTYFEVQCLGKGTNGITDVNYPLLKNGNKSATNKRIDEQVLMFKHLYPQKGMTILNDKSNIQIRGKKKWEMSPYLDVVVLLTGEADWITPYSENGISFDSIITDLKYTSDIRSTFGYEKWGHLFTNPNLIDYTQATMYHLLFDLPFAYWLFDGKTTGMENKFFFVNLDPNHSDKNLANAAQKRLYDFRESVNKTVNEIVFNFRRNWPAEPTPIRCEKCAVSDCMHKLMINTI